MIRLATVNGNPVSEKWEDLPRNTIVTVSLAKKEVDGLYYGLFNIVEATGRMTKAVDAAREGRHEDAEREINRTIACLATSCSFAADVYRRVQAKAVRTNRRKSKAEPA